MHQIASTTNGSATIPVAGGGQRFPDHLIDPDAVPSSVYTAGVKAILGGPG